jgi:hypothetical protein
MPLCLDIILPAFAAEFLLQLLEPGRQIGTTLSRTAIALSTGGNRIPSPFSLAQFLPVSKPISGFPALRTDPIAGR